MIPAPLHIVSTAEAKPETVGERVRRLQAESRQAAADHVSALAEALALAETLAAEISIGGEAYQAGAKGIARDVVIFYATHGPALNAIRGRGR